MAKLAADTATACLRGATAAAAAAAAAFGSEPTWRPGGSKTSPPGSWSPPSVRACSSNSMHPRSNVYRELGLFSLKKKIEDTVFRAESMATSALEFEEARRIRHEEKIKNYDLWDNLAESNDILVKLADSARTVDALKDLAYKAEEAKLITQLAEMDAINYGLFEQAYSASLDVGKLMDQYAMLKVLKGPYDAEGASMLITAGPGGVHNELWAQQVLSMYVKWAERYGFRGRITKKCVSMNSGITSASVDFEFDYAYGYLQGERGLHRFLSTSEMVNVTAVDVVPLFLGTTSDFDIDEEDLIVLCPSTPDDKLHGQCRIVIQHAPTGVIIESSGERSQFGNKMKALNRLKARLLVIASEQGCPTISNIRRDAIVDEWKSEVREYQFHPFKLVKDVKTGIELPDTSSVLDGNIQPLIGAHINMRYGHD